MAIIPLPGGAAIPLGLGLEHRPLLLLIQAGRGRVILLISASPTPSIREYSPTG
jgi:hypothetical protein